MMLDRFFLTSDDWGEPWGPRECERVGSFQASPTKQWFVVVHVNPDIPGRLLNRPEDTSQLLLGNTTGCKSLSPIVDIYATNTPIEEGVVKTCDLIRIGMGKVYGSREQAEIAFGGGRYGNTRVARNMGEFSKPVVRFLSEQDGGPERRLKSLLTKIFEEQEEGIRGYLAQVDYGEPSEFNVVLCLRMQTEPSEKLYCRIECVFSEMFRRDEHLDVLLLQEKQEKELATVCQPFFDSIRTR